MPFLMGARVIILVPNGIHGKGGIERLMLYFTRALPSVAMDVTVETHPTRLVERAPFNHATTLLSYFWFACRLAVGQFDVVHVNIAPRGSTWRKSAFLRLARLFGLKSVLHLHGSGYDRFYRDQSPTRQARIRRLFHAADRVVVLGEHWLRFVAMDLGVDAARTVLISNGAPDTVSRADPSRAPVQIGFAGLIGERKGVDVLVEALSQLPGDAEWRALIGGNGEIERFTALAKEKGIADRVSFLGWLDEAGVDRLMTESQAFVLPSRAENQPMSIIEAMARGLPVIATNVGAIPEQVEDGVTGRIVESADSDGLAQALIELISSREMRARMGAAGRERFEHNYSIETNVKKFVEIYRQLCE